MEKKVLGTPALTGGLKEEDPGKEMMKTMSERLKDTQRSRVPYEPKENGILRGKWPVMLNIAEGLSEIRTVKHPLDLAIRISLVMIRICSNKEVKAEGLWHVEELIEGKTTEKASVDDSFEGLMRI